MDILNILEQNDVLLADPTWRANYQRISEAGITTDVNADAVKFLSSLKAEWGSWSS